MPLFFGPELGQSRPQQRECFLLGQTVRAVRRCCWHVGACVASSLLSSKSRYKPELPAPSPDQKWYDRHGRLFCNVVGSSLLPCRRCRWCVSRALVLLPSSLCPPFCCLRRRLERLLPNVRPQYSTSGQAGSSGLMPADTARSGSSIYEKSRHRCRKLIQDRNRSRGNSLSDELEIWFGAWCLSSAKRFDFMVTCNEWNLTKVIPDGLETNHVTG